MLAGLPDEEVAGEAVAAVGDGGLARRHHPRQGDARPVAVDAEQPGHRHQARHRQLRGRGAEQCAGQHRAGGQRPVAVDPVLSTVITTWTHMPRRCNMRPWSPASSPPRHASARHHGPTRRRPARRAPHRPPPRDGQAQAAAPRRPSSHRRAPQRADGGPVLVPGRGRGGRRRVARPSCDLGVGVPADGTAIRPARHPRPRGRPPPALPQPAVERRRRPVAAGVPELHRLRALPPLALRPPPRRDGPGRARPRPLPRLPHHPRFGPPQAHPRRRRHLRLEEHEGPAAGAARRRWPGRWRCASWPPRS